MSQRVAGLSDPVRVPVEPDPDDASASSELPPALRGAIAAQDINVVERERRVDAYGHVPTLKEIAEREQALRDEAVRTVLEEDAHQGLMALNWLKPLEFNQALRKLQDAGVLDDFVEDLSPEDLMVFTRRLTEAGIFKWVPAQDANGQALPGAPRVIQVQGFDPPEEIRALAHDINLTIAKLTPGQTLYEPDTGAKLHPSSFHLFNWRGDLIGNVESMLGRYHAVLDIETAVHELRPGDTWELSAELGGEVKFAKKGEVTLKGELKVGGIIDVARNEKGGFTVGAEASVIQGIAAELGIHEVVKLKGALGGGGASRVEWTLQNADDAARLARLLGLLGTPQGAAELIADPKARALLKQVSAVELGSKAVASLGLSAEAELALDLKKEVELGAEASLSHRLKVEYEGGRPKAAVLLTEVEAEWSKGDKGTAYLSFGSSKQAGAHARLEQRIEWRPGASLRDVARAALYGPAVLEVGVDAPRGIAALNGATEVTLQATGEAARLFSGALALSRGDVARAFDGIDAELTFSRVQVTTLSGGATLELAKTGEIGGSLSSKRTHVLHRESVRGSALSLAARLVDTVLPRGRPGDLEPVDLGTL
ncbi:MAG: hypothetical protein IRZ16_07270 [Myxococcaceae bacterium]|nr:hypothetical protein [Myxococcaceae bacterium]